MVIKLHPERSAAPLLQRPQRTGHWLQVLSHLDPMFGGIAASVPALCTATEAQSSFDCPIAAFCEPSEISPGLATSYTANRLRWLYDTNLRNRFKQEVQNACGLHIHGLWETHCSLSAGFARASKRPYVISAHGMLDPWALHHKRLKKALYAALVETRTLQHASCLRALTPDEVDDYRRLGLTNPVAIIPSGVDTPARLSPEPFLASFPHLAGKRIVLFLGRLHPKKGLALLMRAWSKIEPRDAHLVIAGPDSERTLAALEQMRDEWSLHSSVTFAGMLSGDRKWSALAAAGLFVLPSFSEGFSIAVLEAMSAAVPVLITHACHLPDVAARNCGWIVDPQPDPLTAALEDFLATPSPESVRMGERGRTLVNQRFRWPVIGRQMAALYSWLRGGPKPAGVELV